jgi:hypothetical protein
MVDLGQKKVELSTFFYAQKKAAGNSGSSV